jgi:2-polyprenyl-6-methoxyphenol hydroxylase-like FAD-dependent oxidoreductase
MADGGGMEHTASHPSHDVVVVGARTAGAPTAMLLARQGFDVAIVDRADLPSDTLSTHAISRGGVVQLARWGLLDDVVASCAPPIRAASFFTPQGRIDRELKDTAGVDFVIAPRRHVLDDILLRAAEDAGATVRTGVSVVDTLTDRRGRVTGVSLRDRDDRASALSARLVVGADGVRSRIARLVGAKVLDQRPSAASTSYTYVAGLGADRFEFHLGPGSFAGVFPTHDAEANVWVCLPGDGARLTATDRERGFLSLLEQAAPELAARVAAARITAPIRSAVGLPNHVLEAAGPGWALVGDAGYHRDPITGHGITDAFRDAELLADHVGQLLRGEVPEPAALAAYQAERDDALAPIFELTWQLAQLPPVERFIELQKQLAALIDAEARWLAERPLPAGLVTASAA